MNITEPNQQPDPEAAIHAPINKPYKHMGKIILRRGMKLWRYNYITDEIEPVQTINHAIIASNGIMVKQHRAEHKEHCVYVQAINLKNAQRKIDKLKKRFNIQPTNPKLV